MARLRMMRAPQKYVQGKDSLFKFHEEMKDLGNKFLFVCSRSGYKMCHDKIEKSFEGTEDIRQYEIFGGVSSVGEIERMRKIVRENRLNVVVGVGGGSAIDTAKATAHYEKLPVVIIPTVVATDAPCTGLSVIYNDDETFNSYLFYPKNPEAVIVDSDVIAKSPVKFLVAGMGDALGTYFEARACQVSGATTCAGGQVTQAAIALAKLCFDTLMAEGVKAKLALEAGACTPAVEKVIEANTLLSGIGFESGGLAGAHAIHNGFTVLDECHHMYHGEKVAFGTITQLVLENIPAEELEDIIDWCIELGLPVTLKELGITEVTDEKLMAVATAACAENDTLHNMPFVVTPETVCAAIKAADAKKREASLEVKEETIKASKLIYSPFFFLYKYGRMDCCNFSSVSIISCVRCFTLSSAAGYWFK